MIFNARYTFSMLLILLVAAGCRKEKALSPTNLDENYLVVSDNPNDPVDHQIYLFYQSTGIPSFYKDTISKKQVSVNNQGIPQYSYQILNLTYNPLGTSTSGLIATAHKQWIPAILDLVKTQLLPRLPAGISLPSMLFVDSIWLDTPVPGADAANGWDAFHGFNTVAIRCRDVAAMNAEQKRMYVTSMLAGIAAKRIVNTQNPRLQKEFFSISRELAMPLFQMDVYASYPLALMFPEIPEPTQFGFTQFLEYNIVYPDFEYHMVVAPREADDLRIFLTAALYYTTEEFNAKYASLPVIREKFRIMKEIAATIGLQFPG